MPTNDNEKNNIDRRTESDEVTSENDEVDAGTFWESEDCPPDILAQFWSNVEAIEQTPWTTHFKLLEEAGIALPSPESMDDRQLAAKLWEIIEELARMRIFLSQTNHLSDREFYTMLLSELLHESVQVMPLDQAWAWHLDLLGSGSEEDTFLYLKYYADEEWRQRWLSDFPDYQMPEHEEPQYDRDRLLPTGVESPLIEPEGEM